MMVETVSWTGAHLKILDQTALPDSETYETIETVDQLVDAIKGLKVRGAPALGIAGAMGIALAANNLPTDLSTDQFFERLSHFGAEIATSRPTAVNLRWGTDRVLTRLKDASHLPVPILQALSIDEAQKVQREDRALCERIGDHGAALIKEGMSVLTHCNTGSLATGGIGTALGVIKTAFHRGRRVHVFVGETRPLLQGSRLTAWELQQEGIPHTLICDNMAGALMRQGKVDCALVGADRIAANGDTANKIGTYSLAVLCRFHHIPFYVAAPFSTIDKTLSDGESIPIEERSPSEVVSGFGRQTAPLNTRVHNPAFDVTPFDLISAIITENQVHYGPHYDFKP